jgi:hypothetical protein
MGKKDKKSTAHKERVAQKVLETNRHLTLDSVEAVKEGSKE